MQGHVVHQLAVDAHAHQKLFLVGLDVDIGRAGVVAPHQQAVEQLYHGGLVVLVEINVPREVLHLHGVGVHIGLGRGIFGLDLSVMVLDGVQDGRFGGQGNVYGEVCHQLYILDGVEVQRVVHDHQQMAALHRCGNEVVAHGQSLGNLGHRLLLHGIGGEGQDFQVELLPQGAEQLGLGDGAHLDEHLAPALALVLFLQGQRLGHLRLADVTVFHQHFAKTDVFHSGLPFCALYTAAFLVRTI